MIDHSYSKYSSLYGSGGSRGGARGAQAPPYFWTKLRPEDLKKIFVETAPPLSQGLMTGPPPYLTVWIHHCMGHFG